MERDVQITNESLEFSDPNFLQLASQYADDGLIVQSLDGVILWANSAYFRMMGCEPRDVIGRNPMAFCMPDDTQPTDEQIARFRYNPLKPDATERVVRRNKRKSGELFWNEITHAFHTFDDGRKIAILVCRDVSDRVEVEWMLRETSDKLAQLASVDTLTGISNRSTLMRVLDDYLVADRPDHVGLLHLDLDHFKSINDTHGHSAGDAVIRHVGEKLHHAIRPGDLAARMGGDEFVVVFANIATEIELAQLCRQIAEEIAQPMRWTNRTLQCRASLGAVMVTPGAITGDEVLRRADFALYEAKMRGRNTLALYDSELHARHLREEELSKELTNAVDAAGLDYFFQPVCNAVTGKIVGLETLVRWRHPRLGLLPPDAFLPLAARLGVMSKIDFAAMQAAFALKKRLNEAGFRQIRMGINGSAELLGRPGFFELLVAEMELCGLAPGEVVIEVLETVVFANLATDNPLVAIIQRLHDAGVMTLLDDFGTGYAGLTHLVNLAVSGVKIDRSMTRNLLTDPTSAKIVAMILELCNDLDLNVVIEGIETAQQADALVPLGGAVMQGYWIGGPMPADDVFAWLHNPPDFLAHFDRSAIAPVPQPRYLGANS